MNFFKKILEFFKKIKENISSFLNPFSGGNIYIDQDAVDKYEKLEVERQNKYSDEEKEPYDGMEP